MDIRFINILNLDYSIKRKVRHWRNSNRIKGFMLSRKAIGEEEHLEFLEKLKKANDRRFWVIFAGVNPIGSIYLHNINQDNRSSEWGFYIGDEEYLNKGLSSLILFEFLDMFFNYMEFDILITKVLSDNKKAKKLYKQFRFKEVKVYMDKDKEINVLKFSRNDWLKEKDYLRNMVDKRFEKHADFDFITMNRDFWGFFKEPDSEDILLVEVNEHPIINHSNAVVGKMIAIAKDMRIAWLNNCGIDEKLMKSYSLNSIFMNFEKMSFLSKVGILFISVYHYILDVAILNKIDTFEYKGIPYGDFIYDEYMRKFSKATFYRFDPKVIKIIYLLLIKDAQVRRLLSKNHIKSVLVSHYIGLTSGVLSRVAMQKGIPLYCKAGGQGVAVISRFDSLNERYDFPRKPTAEEIEKLSKDFKDAVEKEFEEFVKPSNDRYYAVFAAAYENNIKSNTGRRDFIKRMNLEDKPNVFIMLHAFNDYPKSYSKRIIFDDYYKWFMETFKFALSDKSKNWIFKEHPENRFYKTTDLNLAGMMKKLPPHIKFVAHDSDIKASTVLNVADLIVTCIGTAGVEMSALRGIPSLIAGTSFYDGFGFTIEPASKNEYFDTLKRFKPYTLSEEQRLKAKSCYLYNNKYSLVDFTAGPPASSEETLTNNRQLKDSYELRILKVYKEKKDKIYHEFIAMLKIYKKKILNVY